MSTSLSEMTLSPAVFRPFLLSLLLTLAPASLSALVSAAAQDPSPRTPARIVYTFDHPQLQPSHYTITIDETGAGRFASQPGPVSDSSDGVLPAPVDRPIQLDDSLRASLFHYARAHNFFQTHCTRLQSSLAFTGNKTFSYAGPDGTGSCSFVWAADPALQTISDQLGSVAFTIEEGRRLEVEFRHDRLGLDAELASLQDAVKDRRAAGLPNIAEQLQVIAEDQRVMDRARKRALALLSRCEPQQKPN
jgi:hypothetical protein